MVCVVYAIVEKQSMESRHVRVQPRMLCNGIAFEELYDQKCTILVCKVLIVNSQDHDLRTFYW